ncbi:MAG: L-serine ammonia-lyase, partial [Gammaproteobacteria bacterium]|nr:L-serine ammonia-lyase [Gammaproteobacteria bacterium]
MFISVLELFKIGIGPSSSHTMGPMLAAGCFLERVRTFCSAKVSCSNLRIRCILKGSLSFTGKGHNTDRAVALGLHGYVPERLPGQDVDALVEGIWKSPFIVISGLPDIAFSP